MSSALRTFYKSTTIVDVLKEFSSILKNKICITIRNDALEHSFTHADLWVRAGVAARKISSLTDVGDRVLLPMSTSPEFIEFFFGCILSGRVAVPLPSERSTSRYSRLNKVVKDCQPKLAVFRNSNDLENMKQGLTGVVAKSVEDLFDADVNFDLPKISSSQVALIQYTSGSTSDPKGVILTHSNVMNNLQMIQQGMQITSDERFVSWLPLFHDMGLIGNLLTPLCTGGSTYIYPPQEFAQDPFSWLEIMSEEKGTLSGAPTFAFDLIGKRAAASENEKLDLSNLRLLYCGSERIHAPAIAAFYEALKPAKLKPSTFFPCYGMAEASLYISGGFADPFALPQVNLAQSQYPFCGNLAAGLSIQITGEMGESLPPGEIGEIQVSGASISPGYWATMSDQISRGSVKDASRVWLKTGDLGILASGQLAITGRLKDVIKIRGQNIFAEDIEFFVETLSNWFAPNSVVALPDESVSTEGIVLIAEILRNRRAGPFEGLLREIQVVLSEMNLRCERLILISPKSLPKTSSGKKQRSRTGKMLKANEVKTIWDSYGPTLKKTKMNIDRVATKSAAIKSLMETVNLDLADERRSFPADFIGQLHRNELLGLLIPEKFGGSGLAHSEFARVAESLGQENVSLGGIVGVHNTIGVLPILRSTVLDNKADILSDIAKKGAIAAFAITESEAGSNPRAMKSTVKADGKRLVLNGDKIWIGNAAFAKYITVFAVEQASDARPIGVSAFLLRAEKHKFVVAEEQLTTGLRAMPQNRLVFKNCDLDESDRLSEPGKGIQLAFGVMEYARFGLAAMSVGVMKSGLQKTLSFARSRQIWTGVLADNSYFAQEIEKIHIRSVALESFVVKTAELLDKNGELPLLASLTCKILAGEWASHATDKFVQFTGGRGYTETFGLARFWRDARILRIFEGPSETLAFQLGSMILRQPELYADLCKIMNLNADGAFASSKLIARVQKLESTFLTSVALESVAVRLGFFTAEMIALLSWRNLGSEAYADALLEVVWQELQIDLQKAVILHSSFQGARSSRQIPSGKGRLVREIFDSWNGESESSPIVAEPIEKNENSVEDGKSLTSIDRVSIQPKIESEIQESLQQWVKKHTRVSKVDNSISMASYGVDSLLAYELICFIEEEFQISVPEVTVNKKPSINELSQLIVQLSKSARGNP